MTLNYKTKIFASQHGGCLPGKYDGNFFHQEKISDKFLVWHDTLSKKQYKLSANKLLRYQNKKYDYKNSKNLTIIGYEAFMYTTRAQSTLNCASMKNEVQDCLDLYKNLDDNIKLFTKFRYSHYSSEEGWFI